jgi:hypothetical protein
MSSVAFENSGSFAKAVYGDASSQHAGSSGTIAMNDVRSVGVGAMKGGRKRSDRKRSAKKRNDKKRSDRKRSSRAQQKGGKRQSRKQQKGGK